VVDQDGVVLDVLIQSRRHAGATKRFFKRLLKSLPYVPRVLITDTLRSYGVAKRELLPGVTAPWRRTSEEPLLEQQGRELTSAHSASEAADATLQIIFAGPAISAGACIHLWTLPPTTPSNGGQPLPGLACPSIQGLATGDVCASGGIITLWIPALRSNATISD
jgi:DDE domain